VACVSSYGPVKFSVYPSDKVFEMAILRWQDDDKGDIQCHMGTEKWREPGGFHISKLVNSVIG
jgi:hypothetical protein